MSNNTINSNENNKAEAKKALFSSGEGKATISVSNAESSTAAIIEEIGMKFVEMSGAVGMAIQKGVVAVQGVFSATSKAENISKGEYSENPRSAKIFTYKETILPESIPKDIAAQVAGAAGVNLSVGVDGTTNSFGMDGMSPLITDFGIGEIEPHIHTIVTQHVHRIEPAYLYRVPSVIGMMSGALKQLQKFFAA